METSGAKGVVLLALGNQLKNCQLNYPVLKELSSIIKNQTRNLSRYLF